MAGEVPFYFRGRSRRRGLGRGRFDGELGSSAGFVLSPQDSPRSALILIEGGAEAKTYSAAAQAILLVLLVPAYGAFASRVARLNLITWVTIFFVAFFFIWVGVFRHKILLLFAVSR